MENNSSAAETCTKLYALDKETAAIIKSVAMVILGLLAIICNILILGVLIKNREMRTTTNIFIANMAVSDLLFGLMVVPKEIALQFSNHLWLVGGDFGSFSCKLVYFVQDASTAVSICSHVSIAIERFYAVVFPLRARRSGKYLRLVVVAVTWLVSVGFYGIYFHIINIQSIPFGILCDKNWGGIFGDDADVDKNYYLLTFSCLYAAPTVIIAFLYAILLHKLNSRHVVGNDSAMRSAREALQNKRVVRLSISIVSTFILLWMPVHIIAFFLFFRWKNRIPCELQSILFAGFYLAWSSCFSNPLIYFLFSENYRNGLKNLLGFRLAIHPRIHPRVQAVIETTEGGTSESRVRSTRIQRSDRLNEETVA